MQKILLIAYLVAMQFALSVTAKANTFNSLPPCTNTSSLKKDTICDGDASKYPYHFNGLTITISGTYTVHFTNAGGCDSAAILQLVVNNATIVIFCKVDADGDGYGDLYNGGAIFNTCDGKAPTGYVLHNDSSIMDFNDNDPTVWNRIYGMDYDYDGDGVAGNYGNAYYGAGIYYGNTLPAHLISASYLSGSASADCDDNNPHVWYRVNVYHDNDGDGVGYNWEPPVNGVYACAGDTTITPYGYSIYNTDCNDGSTSIRDGAYNDAYLKSHTSINTSNNCRTIVAGDTAIFIVNTSANGYYIIDYNSNNNLYIPVSFDFFVNGVVKQSSTSSVFKTDSLTNGSVVTCLIHYGVFCECGLQWPKCYYPSTTYTDSITMHISSAPLVTPTINILASDTVVCYGLPITFTANATNQGSSPIYQWKVNGVAVGSNSNTFTSSTLNDKDSVTCVLISSLGNVCPESLASNIIKMHILTAKHSTTYASICNGNSYNFNGNIYTASGTYQVRYATGATCDSVATLVLKVLATSASTSNVTICSNLLPYIWNGSNYTTSGAYTKHFTNVKGCDSTVTLNLTIKDTSLSIINIAKCSNYFPFSFNGTLYYTAGTYDKHFTNATGCDSIARLVITPIATSSSTKNDTAVVSYVWNGNTYINSGTYTHTATSAAGCDSVATLILIIQPQKPNIVTSTTTVTSGQTNVAYTCSVVAGAVSYQWDYSGSGATISNNGNKSISVGFGALATSGVLTVVAVGSDGVASKPASINVNVSKGLFVSGKCISPKNNVIMNTSIKLFGSIPNANLALNGNGIYQAIIDSANASNIVLKPTKNNDITKVNGVTSVDALLVQRHILNTTKLNNAYKIIAADVDGNKAINSVDVLRIKRLILGTDTTFTKGTGVNKVDRLWEFVDSAYVFPDTTNPFPFKDSIAFTNLTSNKTNQTFIGVKLGDVNYDWNPALAKQSIANSIQLLYNVILTKEKSNQTDFSGTNLRNDDVIRIPMTVTNFKELVAMQYTLHFDNKNYKFVGIENNKIGIDFNEKQATGNGNISMLWTDKNAEPKTLEDGTELFTLVLRSTINSPQLTDLALTNDITEIEAWDKDFNQHNIILTKQQKLQTSNTEQWSVSPNPTNGDIKVNIASKVNNTVSLELTDAQGKLILKRVAELQKGNNSFTLNLKQNNNITTGIYFLKAVGVEGQNVKRIMVK